MKKLGYFWMVLLWVFALLLSQGLDPNAYREGLSRDPLKRVEVNKSSLARILGEFRTGMSDMLFIKTERYLHSGVGYVPHLNEKLLSVEGTSEGVEHHLEEMHEGEVDLFHHDEEVETLLPSAQTDYRGWIGRMQRQVKPWRDPALAHRHTDGRELIPWFRMMTVSDPGYIRGYIVGASWVQRSDREAALSFLEEGLENNPEAFQIYLSIGFLQLRKARSLGGRGQIVDDDPDQLPLLLEARKNFRLAADFMVEQRPHLGPGQNIEDFPEWNDYMESDAMAATGMAVELEERFGDMETADILRAHYLKVMPEFTRLRK